MEENENKKLVLQCHLKICKIREIKGYSHFLRMPILLLANPLASENAEDVRCIFPEYQMSNLRKNRPDLSHLFLKDYDTGKIFVLSIFNNTLPTCSVTIRLIKKYKTKTFVAESISVETTTCHLKSILGIELFLKTS